MNGSANKTPRKRKCSEYRDPDYAAKRIFTTTTSAASPCKSGKSEIALSVEEQRLQRVREIVEREFSYEIQEHQNKLENLETNIENAIKLFDKLRYKLVADYYAKHEIQTNDAEAALLRGEHTLLQNEPLGAQLPRHPSLKNLLTNNAKNLSDLLRNNPQRAAAKQALCKIDEVTKAGSKSQQKREQRRIQKLIREQGIVIDHSKVAETETSKLFDKEISQLLGQNLNTNEVEEKPASTGTGTGTALNYARLNNKVKHLIIVGNTSKYIEDESAAQLQNESQRLTHKWLIYVQAKDATITPLEKLLKKIRFYLHPSYKPHDIVDIKSPPYQLSRRGWGEFPVRLQLFFVEELQQKPVQLLHNLVLDKTLTGLQTMGAETLVEIWLRPLQLENSNTQQLDELNEKNVDTLLDNNLLMEDLSLPHNSQRMRTLSLGQFKYDDLHNDELFEFLNCIENTPNMLAVDDIEKIQPTVVVNDPNLTSPSKLFNLKSSPKITTTTTTTTPQPQTPTKTAVRNLFNEINATTTSQVPNNIFNETNITTTTIPNNIELTAKTKATAITTTTTTPRLSTLKCYPQTSKPAVLCLKPQAPPTTTSTNLMRTQNSLQANKITPAKSYEKKIVQLVDGQGKVRLVQMLVATTTTTNQANKNDAKNINNKIKPSPVTFTNSPFVFQKEGKIYIRDPLQNKLRQQQKQQVSLLKPQVSLLKPLTPINAKPTVGIHMSLRETREMKQDNLQLLELSERQKIEKIFENSKFDSLSSASEFLLRRLPLIATTGKKHLHAYDFIYCKSLTEFKQLSPMKQRALEWLRAKYISQLVRAHKQLKQRIAATKGQDKLYWSTKEIVIFARNYAYTPPLNQLQAPLAQEAMNEESRLKAKIQTETQLLYYNTLTSMQPIQQSLNELEKEQPVEEAELQIDVVKMDDKNVKKSRVETENVDLKNSLLLPVPEHLESAALLAEEVCRSLRLRLTPTEEIVANVRQPLAKTVLAQCVQLFVEKLLRRAISVQATNQINATLENPTVSIQDLAKVIANPSFSDDYDFYNDNYLGVQRTLDQSDKEDA